MIPIRCLRMRSKLSRMRYKYRVRKGPVLPTADQVVRNTMRRTSHSVIGVCLVSQGNHQTGHIRESHIPQQRYRCVNWTIFFLNRRGDTDILTALNFLHCPSGASLVQCWDKGPADHVVQAATTFMDFLGLEKICLRTDGEPASGAPAQAIKMPRNNETQLETTPQLGAVGTQQSKC